MKDSEVPALTDSSDLPADVNGRVIDVEASRALAVDRIIKGGALAVLGCGAAFGVGSLSLAAGPLFWVGICSAATALGAGALWAGMGASHLVRYGRTGSSLGLISLAGLGGSVLLQVFTFILMGIWTHPVLVGLNLVTKAVSGLFVAALLIIGLITVVRWMLGDSDPDEDD